jgi:endo-alpha-1,4-polygalactosaminidase (GH114 family)
MSYQNYSAEDLIYAEVKDRVEDSSSWDANFTFTQGNDYVLTIDYDDDQENISIGTKANQSVYVGFFDISITGSETTYKDKFQKNYTLP